MDVYKINDIYELIKDNPYVGRGIIVGKSLDGINAVSAYFIMGRSANSRNRIFVMKDGALFTEPYDASKCSDPSLIIYAAVRENGNKLIVTNGDQTDTINDGLNNGKCFGHLLKTRKFEPDGPNFTPRISAMLTLDKDDYKYKMSILKSADAEGTACNRYTFDFEPLNGLGHFLHTYVTDGNPIPSFVGEPERVAIPNDIDEFANKIWDGLNEDNKISLFVRYTNLQTGQKVDRIINKNK